MNVLWRYIDEIVGKGLPFTAIVELLFYATSTLIPLGLPLSTLLAAIMTMGNLGENNELLALKAAGISLFRIMRPIIVVAILISIGSFFVINNYVPYSHRQMANIRHDISQTKGKIEFNDGIFFNNIPNVAIRVGKQDKETHKLTDVLIYDTRDPKITKTIVADSGYIGISTDSKFLRVELYDGHNYEDTRDFQWYNSPSMRHHIFEYQRLLIELEGFGFERSDVDVLKDNPASKDIFSLAKNIDSLTLIADEKIDGFMATLLKSKIIRADSHEYLRLKGDSVGMLKVTPIVASHHFDTMSITNKSEVFDRISERLTEVKNFVTVEHDKIRTSTFVKYNSQINFHEKMALPISVFIFFLIGAPLGAIIRKGGLGLPVVISIFFFIVYYILTLTGNKMVSDGVWPPIIGQWLSSIVLLPLAIFLCYKSTTDSQLFNKEAYYIFIDKIKAKIKILKSNVKTKHNRRGY